MKNVQRNWHKELLAVLLWAPCSTLHVKLYGDNNPVAERVGQHKRCFKSQRWAWLGGGWSEYHHKYYNSFSLRKCKHNHATLRQLLKKAAQHKRCFKTQRLAWLGGGRSEYHLEIAPLAFFQESVNIITQPGDSFWRYLLYIHVKHILPICHCSWYSIYFVDKPTTNLQQT